MTRYLLSLFLACLIFVAAPQAGYAAQGDCGQPVSSGTTPVAADCLFILKAAVGALVCDPICVCDTTGEGGATASDALLCLKKAVGQNVTLTCPTPCGTVTTSTSTTSSSTSSSTSSTLPVGLTALDMEAPEMSGGSEAAKRETAPAAPAASAAPALEAVSMSASFVPQMCSTLEL